ncbi:hypothetical protein BU14_0203s0007 [Porphyra umbilicalis]|uniref:Alpha/beta hydrolase fold-3 domain-containing protein n=1 Tax=Porphyra umbilicalis TaxID=2786 RepID=A0A1X6P614_PORUM|nr:hypothetical protein BU14_0203s0007 [Porphyra umbilicalis]|eukprot:OSX76196.1 hypothetical protein BU14_0203s0007 [Porphyra umbilicalis]
MWPLPVIPRLRLPVPTSRVVALPAADAAPAPTGGAVARLAAHVAALPAGWPRLAFGAYALQLLAAAAASTVASIPLGVRLAACRWAAARRGAAAAAATAAGDAAGAAAPGLRVTTDVAYGSDGARQRYDWYTPGGTPPPPPDGRWPTVVVFVHGGAWGSGDTWHYALLAGAVVAATRLPVAIATTRVWPAGGMEAQAADVAALLRHVAAVRLVRGGRTVLWGHSSGAHVCVLALLRAAGLADASARGADGAAAAGGGVPLPAAFIGAAGVYDVGDHYAYEAWRGVSEVSTMKPAAGGRGGFAALSPTRLLRDAVVGGGGGGGGNGAAAKGAAGNGAAAAAASRDAHVAPPPPPPPDAALEAALLRVDLEGDVFAARAGYGRPPAAPPPAPPRPAGAGPPHPPSPSPPADASPLCSSNARAPTRSCRGTPPPPFSAPPPPPRPRPRPTRRRRLAAAAPFRPPGCCCTTASATRISSRTS